MDQFRELSGLGETDGVKAASRQAKKSFTANVYGLAGGLKKRKFLPARGAPLSRPLPQQARERLGKTSGVGDGGGTGDELRVGAVVGADPLQAPQHLGHVAAHDSPVGVDFVDHHERRAEEPDHEV